jgi:hypothetical protein
MGKIMDMKDVYLMTYVRSLKVCVIFLLNFVLNLLIAKAIEFSKNLSTFFNSPRSLQNIVTISSLDHDSTLVALPPISFKSYNSLEHTSQDCFIDRSSLLHFFRKDSLQ